MSAESLTWLNTQTLIGQTDIRGNAWHYLASEQGTESNHYPGFIPVEDIRRRLFSWEHQIGDVCSHVLTPEGVTTFTDPTRQAIIRPAGALSPDDKGGIMGLFKSGYLGHGYAPWLLDQVAAILDDELGATGAGLLRMGAQAFVCVSVPDTITTPSGVEFLPNLLAVTSFDGSLATTYKRCVTNVVCDNTMAAGLREAGGMFKVKHTKYSNAKLIDARAALELVHSIGEDFTAQVEELTNTTVTDAQFAAFLESLAPRHETDGTLKTGRGLTMATNKHAALKNLIANDQRVQPWAGTAYGVLQAVNTYEHHIASPGKSDAARAESNMNRAVSGGVDTLDRGTLATLELVLA